MRVSHGASRGARHVAMGAAGNTASTHWLQKLGDTEIISSYQLEGVRYDKSG